MARWEQVVNRSLNPDKALIFRIVHVDNIGLILDNGLRCYNSDCLDPNYIEIGNPGLITDRKPRAVLIHPGGNLSDYVPFYFTPYSIMLLNIITGRGVRKRRKDEIAFLVSSLPRLRELNVPFLFTDRHAYPVNARYFSNIGDLSEIDWPLLQSRDFQHDPEKPDKKARYQAEALIYRKVPLDALLGIVCYSREVGQKLQGECKARELDIQVKIRPTWYF